MAKNDTDKQTGTSPPSSSSTDQAKIDNSIIPTNKPSRDPNKYRILKLSTGLTVLLISRNITERVNPVQHNRTSVAVVVNVGGLNDPMDCEGLAHFTEHMVHLGSKKFPQDDAISLVKNFGTFNAFTGTDTTTYSNVIPDILLEKNLELFSNMLIQPLFELDALNGEVNIVDDELHLRLPSWRKSLLQIHVGIKAKTHPLARFWIGSLETLGNVTGGARVQATMKENHEKNYVASAMTLSINSTKSLDELERLTLTHFSNFLQGGRPILSKMFDEKTPEVVFEESQHVYLQGISNNWRELSLRWHLPASLCMKNAKECVMPLIVRMLTDTSPTSLDYNLRRQELIWELYHFQCDTLYATILEINFLLTDKGSLNIEQIIKATFDYFNFLQNGSFETEMYRLFQEMRIQNLREYHYGNQRTSFRTVEDLAMRLQCIENAEDVLSSKSWRDAQFNFKNVQNTLAMMKPDNVLVVETLQKGENLGGKGQIQIAPHSGAKYVVTSRNQGDTSRRIVNDNSVGANLNFGFIPENKYLALDLLANNSRRSMDGSGDSSGYVLRCPENFGDIEATRLSWCSRQDTAQGDAIPKISGYHHGHSKLGHNPLCCAIQVNFYWNWKPNPMNLALITLWTYVIVQNIMYIFSEFTSAGYKVSIYSNPGLSIRVEGFPRNVDTIMKSLITHIFEKAVTPSVFSLAKQQLNVHWENYLSDSETLIEPIIHCGAFPDADMSLDFLGSLKEITLDNLKTFIGEFQNSAFAQVILSGNLPVNAFHTIAAHLEEMPFAPLVDNNPELYNQRFVSVNPDFYVPGETCVRVINKESLTYTTTVTNVYVLGPYGRDQRQADFFSLAMYFMNSHAFKDLRTRQQLGYVVYTSEINFEGTRVPVMMFSVTVVATARKYSACELDQKIDQFLAEYGDKMEKIQPELFQTMLQLAKLPSTVKQADVAAWFKEKFGPSFGNVEIDWKCALAGVKKQSIQVLTGNAEAQVKVCRCLICSSVNEWKCGRNCGSQLQFAVGNGITKDYFISSPKF